MGAFAELKKFRGKIFLCCIVLAVAAFSSMFLPTIMSDIIDNGINVGNMDYILKNGLLMVVLAVISMISYLLSARLIAGIVVNFSKNLKKVWKHWNNPALPKPYRIEGQKRR